jgi:hypothetical protein
MSIVIVLICWLNLSFMVGNALWLRRNRRCHHALRELQAEIEVELAARVIQQPTAQSSVPSRKHAAEQHR